MVDWCRKNDGCAELGSRVSKPDRPIPGRNEWLLAGASRALTRGVWDLLDRGDKGLSRVERPDVIRSSTFFPAAVHAPRCWSSDWEAPSGSWSGVARERLVAMPGRREQRPEIRRSPLKADD